MVSGSTGTFAAGGAALLGGGDLRPFESGDIVTNVSVSSPTNLVSSIVAGFVPFIMSIGNSADGSNSTCDAAGFCARHVPVLLTTRLPAIPRLKKARETKKNEVVESGFGMGVTG